MPQASQPLPKIALAHMDMVRGLAAIAVLIGHVRGLFLVDAGELQNASALNRAYYVLTGFGHQAVVVFFVLSGFFIASSVLGAMRDGRWSWRSFLLRRFTRLYIVLLPILLLTAALDGAGMRIFGTDNFYGGHLHAPFIHFFDVERSLRLPSLIGNALFLQGIAVDPYGTNNVLWSLSLEFWSYLLFPLILLACRRGTMRTRAAYAVAAIAILSMGGGTLVFYFAIWLLGAVVAFLWQRIGARLSAGRGSISVAMALFLTALLAGRLDVAHLGKAWDVVLGVATAAFLVALLARQSSDVPFVEGPYARLATRLAGFSYTLYLVHFPIVVFANAWLVGVERWMPSAANVAFTFGLDAAILAIAYGVASVTEHRTEVVRSWAERGLSVGTSDGPKREPQKD